MDFPIWKSRDDLGLFSGLVHFPHSFFVRVYPSSLLSFDLSFLFSLSSSLPPVSWPWSYPYVHFIVVALLISTRLLHAENRFWIYFRIRWIYPFSLIQPRTTWFVYIYAYLVFRMSINLALSLSSCFYIPPSPWMMSLYSKCMNHKCLSISIYVLVWLLVLPAPRSPPRGSLSIYDLFFFICRLPNIWWLISTANIKLTFICLLLFYPCGILLFLWTGRLFWIHGWLYLCPK